jgi:hypothetical protein
VAYRLREASTNFTAGELSPLMRMRHDTKLYRNGAAKLTNLALLAQGGGRTRPGLKYLATVLSPAVAHRTAPFVFNDAQRYVFVFSNTRADIFQPDGTLAASLTSAPWTTAMLPELAFEQFGDTMWVTHPDMPMQEIKRTGATSFTRAAYAFEEPAAGFPRYQPYYKFAATAMTLAPGATSGSGVALVLSGAGAFVAGHVGTIIRYKKKEILVTAVTDANNAVGTVRQTLPATAADTDWDEQAFSAVRGYAGVVALYGSRLWLGRAKSLPSGTWGSKLNAFTNFDVGTALDNEAIWESVGDAQISEVRHLVGARHLMAFTDGGVFYVPSSPANPLTPENFEWRKQQPYGASFVRPAQFDSATLFVQKTGAVVREAFYIDNDGGYAANPVSLVAEHLIADPVDMAVLYGSAGRQEQYAVLVNGDGNLSVFHSVRDEQVAGWTPWTTTGTFKTACTAGDNLFVTVQRTLNGTAVTTLEVFDDTIAALDCSKRATSGSATRSFTGFTHLANETVQAVSKGHVLGAVAVSAGGAVTLDASLPAVTEIEVGFAFEQRIRPMPLRFDLPDGSSHGRVLGVARTSVECDRSGAFGLDGEDVLLAFAGDDYASAAPTLTGTIDVRHLGYDRDGQKNFIITRPSKVTILGLTREARVNG